MDGAGSTPLAAGGNVKQKKRARRSAAERRRIVEETLVPGASVALVARSHGINANQVFAWRRQHLAGTLAEDDVRKPEVATPLLLPVTVRDVAQPLAIACDTVKAAASAPRVSSGSIHLQWENAQLHVEGNADPAALRLILECLLG